MHADSVVTVYLGGACSAFTAEIGVDDEVGDGGSTAFEVLADRKKVYGSEVLTGEDAAVSVRAGSTARSASRCGSPTLSASWNDAKPTARSCSGPKAAVLVLRRGSSADEFPAAVPSTRRRRERTMRKIIVCTFLSLDGVMQAPGGPDEDAESGFEHGGWQKPVADDEVGTAIAGWYEHSDAMLLGRKTYEIFASYWPTADPDNPFTSRMNSMHKYVASRTLTSVEWQNSTLLEGDIVDAVRKLKASDGGNINVVGSGDLAQTLMQHGLVDEYRLTIHPVIIGTGKRLFADGAIPTALEPVSVSTTKGGTIVGVYRPNGKPGYDSY